MYISDLQGLHCYISSEWNEMGHKYLIWNLVQILLSFNVQIPN